MDRAVRNGGGGPARVANPARLARLLRPKSIVFVGGANLARSITACERTGFAGDIWVVNPSRAAIAGRPCLKSLAELPGVPDAAFVAVNRRATVEVVGALAALGAGGAVCYAAGFAEMGAEGAALQAALVAAAGTMPIVGPNCYGLLNYLDGAALWPDLEGGERVERGVAIVSQSGNISLNMTMTERSVPIAQVISLGNQAALGPGDFIAPLADDPRIAAIGLYIEGLDDVAGFSRAAQYALARGVPLVALKAGRSELASRIALSHTASLAGSDALVDALFRRLGILRVASLGAFMETLKLLAVTGPMASPRIGVMTCSGGDAALAADLAERAGLEIPPLSPAQKAAIERELPDFATAANPLDYNTGLWGDEAGLGRCFAALLDGDIDTGLLVLDYPRPGIPETEAYDAAAGALIAAAAQTGRRAMVAASFAELLPPGVRRRLLAAGVAPLQGLDDAVTAIAGAVSLHRWHREKAALAAAGQLALSNVRPVAGPAVEARETEVLDEPASKDLLRRAGLTVPEGRVVTAAEAPDAAAEIGFPVALKTAGAAAHKSDVGGVALNLGDAAALRAAARRMAGAGLGHRFLVERMATGAVAELIVGVKRDPVFGPALVIGGGGELVELIRDSVPLLLPLPAGDAGRAMAAEALDGLKVARLLAGYRGRPPGDRAAALDAILKIAAFAESQGGRLLELDVNPLLVLPEGHGCVVADALVRRVRAAV